MCQLKLVVVLFLIDDMVVVEAPQDNVMLVIDQIFLYEFLKDAILPIILDELIDEGSN